MKLKASIATVAILGYLALATPIHLAAQEHSHYKLIDLGTFGGPQSYLVTPFNTATILNDRGMVAGWADTSTPDPFGPNFCFNEDCFVSHTFESRNGDVEDLGALPGGASSASSWISKNGLVAGFSQNGEIDPLFPGLPEVRAVVWKNGHITDLGTLPEGGYESMANAVNSRGQVVGLATNTTPDLNSIFGFGFQIRAFRWDERSVMQDLGTLGGTDASATFVNERGEIVGESYTSSAPSAFCAVFGFPLSTGVFLWRNGKMKNIGSFGGTCTIATDLNSRGEIVGLSTLPGDQLQHAFLWQRGSLHELRNGNGGNDTTANVLNEHGDVAGWASLPGDQEFHAALWENGSMTNLGTLDRDQCSTASSINSRGQVVGLAAPCDFSQITAFLWENGSIVDLNTLVTPSSSLYLSTPVTINDRGEIAGVGLEPNGNQHAFLLIPCDENHPGVDGCDYSVVEQTVTANAAVPATGEVPKAANSLIAQSLTHGTKERRSCLKLGAYCPVLFRFCCPGLRCVAFGDRNRCD